MNFEELDYYSELIPSQKHNTLYSPSTPLPGSSHKTPSLFELECQERLVVKLYKFKGNRRQGRTRRGASGYEWGGTAANGNDTVYFEGYFSA